LIEIYISQLLKDALVEDSNIYSEIKLFTQGSFNAGLQQKL